MHQPTTSIEDHLIDNISHAKDPMNSSSRSALHMSLSEPTTIMTDAEDETIVSSAVSVKRIKLSSIRKVKNTEKRKETENADIKPINPLDNNGNISAILRSAVSGLPMNKLPNMDETKKVNSSITLETTLSASSTIPLKTGKVKVSKIQGSKIIKNQRPRASSVGSISNIQLDKSSIVVRPMADHSKASMLAVDGKANTSSGVTVRKVLRKRTTSHSHRT
jgi:hypothetical protein